MDGSQVGVLKERDKVGFGSLLESHDGRGLESKVGLQVPSQRGRVNVPRVKTAYLEVLGDFTDKSLEGKLPDKELGRPRRNC